MNQKLLEAAFDNNYKFLMSSWEFNCNDVTAERQKKYPSSKSDFTSCILAFDSFINKISKLNQGVKYQVFESKEVINELTKLPANIQSEYQIIKNNFINGNDNTSFCSKKHLDYTYKDNTLRHHGIYHFHFAKQPKRTSELLFVKIYKNNVYMITIKDHQYFQDIEIFNIINNNWDFLLHKIPGRIDARFATEMRQPKKLKILLDADINTVIELSDGTCLIGCGDSLGINSIGIEMSVTNSFNSRRNFIHILNNQINHIIKFNEYYQPIHLAVFNPNYYALHLTNIYDQHCFMFSIPTNNIKNTDLLGTFPVLNQLNKELIVNIDKMQKLMINSLYCKGFSIIILNQYNDHIIFRR